MFRLLKLTAFALFGWFLYEALSGISAPVRPRIARSQPPRRDFSDLPSQEIFDPSGGHRMQKVGRGVRR